MVSLIFQSERHSSGPRNKQELFQYLIQRDHPLRQNARLPALYLRKSNVALWGEIQWPIFFSRQRQSAVRKNADAQLHFSYREQLSMLAALPPTSKHRQIWQTTIVCWSVCLIKQKGSPPWGEMSKWPFLQLIQRNRGLLGEMQEAGVLSITET